MNRSLLMRVVLAGGVLAMVGMVVLYVATRERPPQRALPIQARLELAAGEVTLTSGKQHLRAISGTPLLANVLLETAKGARASVRLPDGASIFVRDLTKVKLDETALRLEQGEYWLDAPPADREPLAHEAGEVSVSAADSGLSIRREGPKVTVYVARGMATVSGPGGRVEVRAGEQASIDGAAAPLVAAVAFWDDWTGGMADFESGRGQIGAGTGTIYGVDSGALAGDAARRLEIAKQAVRATVREGLSETEVDQTFFNPGERPVEGWYWFTVPERASVTSFAVETDGRLVEGEFTERKEAAAQYGVAKATGHSPAILEWVDNRTYRARIYPIEAGGTRRVVLRYLELRPLIDGKLAYVYPMGGTDPVRIGEFSLTVDLGKVGERLKIATLADARVEDGGRRVTMRRSGYTPRAAFQLEAQLPESRQPFTVARYEAGGESADYLLARYTPDVDWKAVTPPKGEVVVVVDTSAAGDDAALQLKTATAEAILRALSDEDRFALVSLDAKPTVLHPKTELAPASDQEIERALEKLAEHSAGGATDLSALFDVALQRLHGAEQPAVIYVGDGIATSGDMSGEQLIERLRRALATSRARLFTVGVGSDADHALLGELARAGGGESFRVDRAEETTARALQLAASLKVPTITDLHIDLGAGLDEAFVTATGKVSRGSEVILLARTHHQIPRRVTVKGRLGGKPFTTEHDVYQDKTILGAFVPRLWAAEYVRRLLGSSAGPDAERGRVVALGLDYGLMTPYTSILALESEAAYQNMGIERKRSRLRGVRLGALDAQAEWRLAMRHADVPAPGVFLGCALSSPSEKESERMAAQEQRATDDIEAKAVPFAAEEALAEQPEEMPAAPAVDAIPRPAPEPSPEPVKKEADRLVNGRDIGGERKGNLAADEGESDQVGQRLDFVAGAAGAVRQRTANEDLGQQAKPDVLEKRPVSTPSRHRVVAQPQVELGTCSDSAARPLAERVLIWRKRLKTAGNIYEVLQRYDAARRACELPDWRAERALLDLLQHRVQGEAEATAMLQHFAARPEVQKHLGKLILRRAVDDRLVAAVERILFGGLVDWTQVDRDLSEIESRDERILKLREILARVPNDPNGGMRLVRLLVDAGSKDEALALGRRLRDQGFMTPRLAQQLGDVLAEAGLAPEAVRTYSEIVEFDAQSLPSRRLLGDIYLGHGWYEPAYRQYETLTEVAPNDALAWLRLAAAAAGAGRVDEALRLERRVASAQGRPGPSDPRRWARMVSAARLARLIAKPPAVAPGQDPKRRRASIERELKELQLFSGPGTLLVLTWEDLTADLLLTTAMEDQVVALGELTDAAPVGLSSVLLATPDAERATLEARLRSLPRSRPLQVELQSIRWDGKDFHVKSARESLAAGAVREEVSTTS